MKELGYINERLYTDVNSFHIYEDEETGKFYAVKAEKKIDLEKCHFEPGGFCGHFFGTEKAFREARPYDVGEPFEIKKRGDFFYHSAPKCLSAIKCNTADVPEFTKGLEEGFFEVSKSTNGETVIIRKFGKTPTGRVMMSRKRMPKLEKECRYFYDFNF